MLKEQYKKKYDITPFISNLFKEYEKKCSEEYSKEDNKHDDSCEAIVRQINRLFSQIFIKGFDEGIVNFQELLIEIPNKTAQTLCDDFKDECLRFIDEKAAMYAEAQMHYEDLPTREREIAEHENGLQRRISSEAKDHIVTKIGMIKGRIIARSDPRWRSQGWRSIERLIFMVGGLLLGIVATYIRSQYFGEK